MRRSRVSLRDHRLAVKAQLESLGIMGGKPAAEYTTRIPEKRAPRKSPVGRAERNVNDDIRDWADSQADTRLWRNNRGDIQLASGGRIRYGVGPNGASDWIGYHTVIVTQAMVGRPLAVFCAVESKKDGKDATDDQDKFINRIIAAGGRAGVARCAADAEAIISD